MKRPAMAANMFVYRSAARKQGIRPFRDKHSSGSKKLSINVFSRKFRGDVMSPAVINE